MFVDIVYFNIIGICIEGCKYVICLLVVVVNMVLEVIRWFCSIYGNCIIFCICIRSWLNYINICDGWYY